MSEELPIIPHPVEFLSTVEGAVSAERRERRKESVQVAIKMVNLHEKNAQLTKEKDQAVAESLTDELTGLPNRRAFKNEFPVILDSTENAHVSLALMLIDIDGLKRTNKKLGLAGGDKLIQAVSGSVRPEDKLYRYGGDEFVAPLLYFNPRNDQTEEEFLQHTEQRVQDKFAESARENEIPEELKVGVSVVIEIARPGDTPESIMSRANTRLDAKKTATYAEHAKQGFVFEDVRMIS